MNFEPLLLVPIGLIAAVYLVRMVRGMTPSPGAPPLDAAEADAARAQAAAANGAVPPLPAHVAEPPRWGIVEFVVALMLVMGITMAVVSGVLADAPLPDLLIAVGIINLLVAFAAVVLIKVAHEQNVLATLFPRVGWPGTWRHFAWLFLLGWPAIMLLVAPIWSVVLQILEVDREPQKLVKELIETEDLSLWIAAIFSAVIVAPIVEEFAFRGLLYVGTRRILGPLGAAVGTGFLFAIVHGSVAALAPLFVLGVLLAIVYERTRSLAVPVLFHAAFNAVSLTLIALAPEWAGFDSEGNPQTAPAGVMLPLLDALLPAG